MSFIGNYLPISGGTLTGSLTMGSSNPIVFNGTNMIADAANSVSLRNGTNAQSLFVYNTYTDASNNEQGGISWSGNVLLIGQTAAPGSGSLRTIRIVSGGNTLTSYSTTAVTFQVKVNTLASTTSAAGMNMPSGTAPTSPTSGDFWYDGTNLKFRDGVTTRTITWT